VAFKGTLKEFKVPDILQLISFQRKSGILTFTDEGSFVTLIFENGFIVGVDSFPKKIELRSGSVLVKQDLISEEMLDRALAIQKRTNQKIGEILLSMGLIGESTISEALNIQASETILSLFKWKKGKYNFKVMDVIDSKLKIIDPLPTDNIIMEGVQMLDEWPLITESIPDNGIIFEPLESEDLTVEIIDDHEDPKYDTEKVFLTEGELGVLKHINGKNSVSDLVEMGIFNEYKIYKSIFNLLKKGIIQRKELTVFKSKTDNQFVKDKKVTVKSLNLLLFTYIILLLLIFAITFSYPMKPLYDADIFDMKNLTQKNDN